MRKITLVGAALVLACISPPPALSSFPPRAGAVWSPDCCGEPVVRKNPEFPAAAVRRGEDGWVVVSGILDERGWVTDPIVLASEPEGVFDSAALKAFDEWRYSAPPSDAGQPREVRALLPFRRPHKAPAPMGDALGGMGGGGQSGY